MGLNRWNTRTRHRRIYAGQMQQLVLLKRDDDQAEGTVRRIVLFQCRRSQISKTGEPIQGDMTSNHRTVWHIPKSELDRVGVSYLNVLDRLVDEQHGTGTWQPESPELIEVKLFGNWYSIACVRTDPA